jgi:hypothetical protein
MNESKTMQTPAGVRTSKDFPVPGRMRAWVLGGPGELTLQSKSVPVPGRAEVLVRIDAVAICATDLDAACRSTRVLLRATSTWARSWRRAPASMNSESGSG